MTAVVLALSLTLSAASHQDPPAPTGTALISGVVTSSAGNRPIPNATIRAVRWVGGLGTQMSARTDAQGRFVFKDLVAGSYDFTAQADGHVTMRYGQRASSDAPRRVELAAAQQFTEADIVLPKFTGIEGQLLDEFGDPMPGVRVMALQVAYVAGKNRFVPASGANSVQPTDDRGGFRVYGLAPGDYFLTAVTGPFAGPTDPAGFAMTFYPGTKNPQDAKPVRLESGRDTRGISFAMSPAPMSTISGLVTDDSGKPIRAGVMLFGLSGGDIRAFVNGIIQSGTDGRFTFRNVAPGPYVIQAYGAPAGGGGNVGRSPFGATVFDVAGDRDDLKLTVKGVRVTGRIMFEGPAPQPAANRVVPMFMPVEFVTSPAGGGPPAFTVNPDWTFEILNMSGERVMRPSVGSPGWTLKSVTIGGKDYTDTPINFRDGDVTDVEVTLTSNGGVIKGTVSDSKGPMPDATIVAFAEDASKWSFPSRFIALGRPTVKGEFTIAGLPAGSYLVAVTPPVVLPQGMVAQPPDSVTLEGLRKTAVRVNVLEGGTASVTLTIK